MRQDLETEISTASTLQDVLMILKKVTMLDTHVGTLAFVAEKPRWDSTNNCGIIKCKPFPLDTNQSEYAIEAYYFKESTTDSLSVDDIVVILFTDRNFINNLKVVDKQPRETNDYTTHSLKFGVVIQTL